MEKLANVFITKMIFKKNIQKDKNILNKTENDNRKSEN